MAVDLETVALMSTYRVGMLPPAPNSLVPGELFVEAAPAGGGPPRIWVGAPSHVGLAGDMALLVPAFTGTVSVITVDAIANPSSSAAVNITGTVAPGVEIELCALAGTNPDFLDQVNAWSSWDATSGSFDVTWYLPPGDNIRVRVRMQADPQTFVDSNLFAVTEP